LAVTFIYLQPKLQRLPSAYVKAIAEAQAPQVFVFKVCYSVGGQRPLALLLLNGDCFSPACAKPHVGFIDQFNRSRSSSYQYIADVTMPIPAFANTLVGNG